MSWACVSAEEPHSYLVDKPICPLPQRELCPKAASCANTGSDWSRTEVVGAVTGRSKCQRRLDPTVGPWWEGGSCHIPLFPPFRCDAKPWALREVWVACRTGIVKWPLGKWAGRGWGCGSLLGAVGENGAHPGWSS